MTVVSHWLKTVQCYAFRFAFVSEAVQFNDISVISTGLKGVEFVTCHINYIKICQLKESLLYIIISEINFNLLCLFYISLFINLYIVSMKVSCFSLRV